MEANNPIEAVDYYKKAINFDPNNTDAMLNLALLYYPNTEEQEWHNEAI